MKVGKIERKKEKEEKTKSEKEKESEKEKKKENKEKENREKGKNKKKIFKIILFVAFLVILVIIGLLIFFLKGKHVEVPIIVENFSYKGFNWTKEYWGNSKETNKPIFFYHTKFYFPKNNIFYNVYFRVDPRENNASIDIEGLKEIKATTYITLDKELMNKKCEFLPIVSFKLAEFLIAIGVDKEVAIFYENYTKPTLDNYIVINSYDFAYKNNVTVILLKLGNETKVYRAGKGGQTIVIEGIANEDGKICTLLDASEKFMWRVIEKLYSLKTIIPVSPLDKEKNKK